MNNTKAIAALQKFSGTVEEYVDIVSRKIMLDIDAGVVNMTPVDSGRAKANWIASIGEPVTYPSTGKDKTGGSTIANAQHIHNAMKGLKPMYLANNLAYIEALENGHSKQAPAGMVKLTVQRVASSFK